MYSGQIIARNIILTIKSNRDKLIPNYIIKGGLEKNESMQKRIGCHYGYLPGGDRCRRRQPDEHTD